MRLTDEFNSRRHSAVRDIYNSARMSIGLAAHIGSPNPRDRRVRDRMITISGSFAVMALMILSNGSPAGAQGAQQIARNVSTMLGAQGRLLWIDATANLTRTIDVDGKKTVVDYTTRLENVVEIVRKAKAAGVNTLVVDAKPLSGEVVYNSKVAPHMRTWKGHAIPDFDVLAAFVAEGHKAGLAVDASINLLGEGHKYFSVGPGYQHPDWQSVVYTVDRGMIAIDNARLPVRVPGEPDDPSKPPILGDNSSILGGAPVGGMVGLESVDSTKGLVNSAAPLGRQLNVMLDASNRVAGVIDSGLLGDDPLIAPEEGRLITATRDSDRAWIAQHLHPGNAILFDAHGVRTTIANAPSEKVAVFVNPLQPDARKHELDIVRELVTNYDIDGLVLDRCRYSNLYNDFSDLSKDAFEKWLGKFIGRWPDDVYAFPNDPGGKLVRGPLYKPWLEFRAQVMRDLVADVASIVRTTKPNCQLGTYVGSWYPEYYGVGVNWGSERTRLRYPWFTPDYPRTGYAEYMDWISTGCYFPVATREDARRQGAGENETVEYAAQLSDLAVASGAFVYGGTYCVDYTGDPDRFIRALKAAARQTQGWMIFDISYLDEYNWWPYLDKAFGGRPATSPDRMKDLLPELRAAVSDAQ